MLVIASASAAAAATHRRQPPCRDAAASQRSVWAMSSTLGSQYNRQQWMWRLDSRLASGPWSPCLVTPWVQVESVSFWAHADWPQTREFLQQLSPEHIMLVHGEEHEMMRLRKALEGDAATRGLRREVHTPANCEAVHIPHR